ncbi:MAG: dipeptide epimerase [Bacteroidia bacterium]
MRIKEIHIKSLHVPLTEPFIISLGRLDYADNVAVIIETEEGLRGYGECSPFRAIHGETSETCISVGRILREVLIGKEANDIEANIRLMDRCIYGNSSIKSAFDIAMHDIAAKKAGLPLFRYLGAERKKTLYTDYTVSIDSVEKMTADAVRIQSNGFPVIKVKLGGEAEEDIRRMKSIRGAVGPEIPIRIDANQGWKKDSAIHILNEIASLNIQHCEEPVSRHLYMQLPEIRKRSPIKIMADESCCIPVDAERLIELGACDMFNIKLGKSGGIYNAMKILKLAEENNIEVQLGGFLESRLGFTATAHLAMCSERVKYIDFDTPLMFSSDPVSGGMEYGSGGRIEIGGGVGLGAFFIPGLI